MDVKYVYDKITKTKDKTTIQTRPMPYTYDGEDVDTLAEEVKLLIADTIDDTKTTKTLTSEEESKVAQYEAIKSKSEFGAEVVLESGIIEPTVSGLTEEIKAKLYQSIRVRNARDFVWVDGAEKTQGWIKLPRKKYQYIFVVKGTKENPIVQILTGKEKDKPYYKEENGQICIYMDGFSGGGGADVWRVPSDTDFTDFTDYVNGYQSTPPDYDYRYNNTDGAIAKSLANISGWDASGTAGTPGNDQASNNATGFTAKPGGFRGLTGSFILFGTSARFWSSSPSGGNALRRNLDSSSVGVFRNAASKVVGFSVRLVRDDTGSDPDGTIYTNDYTGNDGKKYDGIKIGDWVFTLQNLKETKYADGTDIPEITDDTDWENDTDGAWCKYDDDDDNYDEYGALYNWYAVDNEKDIVAEQVEGVLTGAAFLLLMV